jgi:hypothetical protein
MKLEANAGSDRSWVYTCPADLSDDTPTKELFAIRFANSDGMIYFVLVVIVCLTRFCFCFCFSRALRCESVQGTIRIGVG